MPRHQAPQHVFEQFDPEFRLATVLALAAAKNAGSAHINHEHLLMGLVAEPAGLAARLLGALNVDPDILGAQIRAKLGPVDPVDRRPTLGTDSAKAIRAAQRHASRSGELITPAHLLFGLSQPFSGWARKALHKAGVTQRGLKQGYRDGLSDQHPGFAAGAVDWVWDFLPQAGRHMVAGEQAQASGDLPAAIASFERALRAAQEDDLIPGGVGDIYPKLIQANLLAGEIDRAVEWLGEADRFIETFEFRPNSIGETPDTEGFARLIGDLEAAAAAHLRDLRLQLLKDRANIHLGRDEFRLVKETARTLITAAEATDHSSAMAAGRNLLGMALTFTGEDDDAAERTLLASLEPAEFIEPVDIAARTYSLALLAGLRGDDAAAARLAGEAEALFMNLGLHRSVAVGRLAKAEAEVAAGGTMPPTLVDETARIDPSGKAELHAWALRVKAAAERRHNPENARRSIDRAVSMSREHEHRLLLLRCLLEEGRVMVALGNRRHARETFEEALRLSTELEVRFADEARRELKALTGG